MNSNLISKKCIPCEGGTPPFSEEEISGYLKRVEGWLASEGEPKKISKDFKFKDFKEAMDFVNKVAELAESEGHHPDIRISYNRVQIEMWTHAANGLTENDFILAAKIDAL